ncbi:MAG: HAMP domain-containing protein [Desulfobacteraceae bacterium]|nr:HAMP domain-containing protein [Desulfobacteraceae bacterium]
MKNKIGIKIALLTNLFLFIITVLCGSLHVYQLNKKYDQQLKDKGKMASMIGAKSISRIFEEAIDNGILTLSDVMDTDYEEIFGFDPPKYHTKYDRYTDKAFLSFQDEFLKTTDLLYAATNDINGYIPTHNTKFSKPITGDKEKDLKGNRTKRFYKDEISARAVKNKEIGLVQKYQRDTGETVWDISSPIFVKGKHWGTFRVGFGLTQINKDKRSFVFSLGGIILIILFVSMVSMFFLINNSLRPLSDFTRVASDLADGKMDEKIVWDTQDEIGKLADVLERLRVSLKAAMERLSR